MKIGICPSYDKAPAKNFVFPIMEYLHRNNVEVFIDDEVKELFPLPLIDKNTPIDIFITLGGDGTLLYFANKYKHHNNPVFTAINFGSLGFMADIRIEEFHGYLDDLIQGSYTVDQRIILEALSPVERKYSAINDIVLHRGETKSMVELQITIDGQYFNTFQSDGLIISTPTGSTAYNLAAGGPIIFPTLDVFAITPICPHTLTTRPFIIPGSSNIEIKSISKNSTIMTTVDGLTSYPLQKDQMTLIKKAPSLFNLISFPNKDNFFYSILRQKLGWKGHR
jgi:NAD+ kinase